MATVRRVAVGLLAVVWAWSAAVYAGLLVGVAVPGPPFVRDVAGVAGSDFAALAMLGSPGMPFLPTLSLSMTLMLITRPWRLAPGPGPQMSWLFVAVAAPSAACLLVSIFIWPGFLTTPDYARPGQPPGPEAHKRFNDDTFVKNAGVLAGMTGMSLATALRWQQFGTAHRDPGCRHRMYLAMALRWQQHYAAQEHTDRPAAEPPLESAG